MKTQPLVGSYHPCLTAQASLAPDLNTATVPPIATGRCDLLGVLKQEPEDIYLWSPFTSQEPNALLSLSSIRVLNDQSQVIEGAVISARMTAAGINFEFDVVKIQMETDDPITVEMTPDESWPILQDVFAPKPGAFMIPFPAIWVYP